MKTYRTLKDHKFNLLKQYKELIEQAYNIRHTDSALSDISEYKALQVLDQINRLKYLEHNTLHIAI